MTKLSSTSDRGVRGIPEGPRTHLRLSELGTLGLRRLLLIRSELVSVIAGEGPDGTSHPLLTRYLYGDLSRDALEEALPRFEQLVDRTREALHDRALPRRVTKAQAREHLLEEGRVRRDMMLLEHATHPLPRIDDDAEDWEMQHAATKRTERFLQLVTPPGEYARGFEPGFAYMQSPLPNEALQELRANAVIDPVRVSETLPFVPEREKGASFESWFAEKLDAAQTLGDVFATGESLPIRNGRTTTRVIVTHGTHAGIPLDGKMLVTRHRPNGDGLVAYLSGNIERVLRERLHLQRESHGESDERAPWALDLADRHRELQRWNELSANERDRVGKATLALLERIGAELECAQRAPLRGIASTVRKLHAARAAGRAISKNPGALMASIVGLPDLLEELEDIARSRAGTVQVEIDALQQLKREYSRARNHALAKARALLSAPEEGASKAAFEAGLESIAKNSAVPADTVNVQPYAAMRADVAQLTGETRRRVEEAPDAWNRGQTHGPTLGIYTLLKHSRLYELTEELIGTLSLPVAGAGESVTAQEQDQSLHCVRAALGRYVRDTLDPEGLAKTGVPRDRDALLLPETYRIRSDAREYLRALGDIAGAEEEADRDRILERAERVMGPHMSGVLRAISRLWEPSVRARLAMLEHGLRSFRPLDHYEHIASAVFADLALPRANSAENPSQSEEERETEDQ